MKNSFVQRVDLYGRALVPVLLCVFLVILSVIPLPTFSTLAVGPALSMMAVYYWTIQRPDLMPMWAVFLIGIFQDMITGGYLGVSATMLLFVHVAIISQRRFFLSRPFAAAWWGFMIIAAIAIALRWLIIAIIFGQFGSGALALFQYILSLALYPALAWLLALTQRAFVRAVDDE